MNRQITRRDFLDGAAMAIGGVALGLHIPGAQGRAGALPAYPPALTGLRGDQDRVFEYAHKLRDGKSWETFGTIEEDLGVVRPDCCWCRNQRTSRGAFLSPA